MKKSFSEKTLSDKVVVKGYDEYKKNMDMKMGRSVSEKAMAHKQRTKKKSNDDEKSRRFLISINVFGSAGAIRFVVNGDDNAAAVIDTALKMYAREGRLPILGYHADNFFLYPADAGCEALTSSEKIGCRGARNFVLSKREMTEAGSEAINRKGSGWRAWIHKSLSLKILSH